MQSLHPDFRTDLEGAEYFFFGTGKYSGAIQWSPDDDATPFGFTLWEPQNLSRKWGTYLFHPEYGFRKTQLGVLIDNIYYEPKKPFIKVEPSFANGKPQFIVAWLAGENNEIHIQEEFCPLTFSPLLLRNVRIFALEPVTAIFDVQLYGNPAYFTRFSSSMNGLEASGLATLRLMSNKITLPQERSFTILLRPPEQEFQLVYEVGVEEQKFYESHEFTKAIFNTEMQWQLSAKVEIPGALGGDLARLLNLATTGMRGVIAENGRFDSSIWQYGFEWVRDAAAAAEGLVYAGDFETAASVLEYATRRLSNNAGQVAEASRFRGGMQSQLDANGFLLYAWKVYYDWSGELIFSLEHNWQRIKAIANYLLKDEFQHESGLLLANREVWERGLSTGLVPGFDISHQTMAVAGLRAASDLASWLKELDDAERYREAARRIEYAMLHHPTHSLVKGGYIRKRRLNNGELQTKLDEDMIVLGEEYLPEDMPLADSGAHKLEPDVAQLMPILYGIVDPKSDIAKKTIAKCEALWSQAWDGGGYGRYDVSGEPDSSGAWPLATMWMAEAYLLAGDEAKAERALRWLIEKAGKSGAWFEFYGERPTPPLPPRGILVWAWAEYVKLVVKYLMGAHITDKGLATKPIIPGAKATFRFGNGLTVEQF